MTEPAPALDTMTREALIAFADANDIRVTKLPNVRDETILLQIRTALAERPSALPVDAAIAQAEAQPLDPEPQTEDEQVESDVVALVGDDEPAPALDSGVFAAPFVSDPTIAYTHPDNGSCDAWPNDERGRVLAPASAAAELAVHGFIPASEEIE